MGSSYFGIMWWGDLNIGIVQYYWKNIGKQITHFLCCYSEHLSTVSWGLTTPFWQYTHPREIKKKTGSSNQIIQLMIWVKFPAQVSAYNLKQFHFFNVIFYRSRERISNLENQLLHSVIHIFLALQRANLLHKWRTIREIKYITEEFNQYTMFWCLLNFTWFLNLCYQWRRLVILSLYF